MATRKITVLVCDSCGTQENSDDPADTGGFLAKAWQYDSGGAAGKTLYVCGSCSVHLALAEIIDRVRQNEEDLLHA